MSEAKTKHMPLAHLQAKTVQPRLLRAELRASRRWNWFGKQGWWLHCSLLNTHNGPWHMRRFVATLPEACTILGIHEDDWTWQEVAPKATCDRPSQQQAYVPFLMF